MSSHSDNSQQIDMSSHSDNSLQIDMSSHSDNSLQIDMSSHSDTLSWFWANQSVLFLLYAVCLAEKKQILIL